MTPMVDVVLLLIIFFMYTSQFSQLSRTELELPEQRGERDASEDSAALIVDLTATGAMIVAGEPVTQEKLERFVDIEATRLGGVALVDVMIRADRGATAVALDRVTSRLKAAGVVRWKLATSDTGGGA